MKLIQIQKNIKMNQRYVIMCRENAGISYLIVLTPPYHDVDSCLFALRNLSMPLALRSVNIQYDKKTPTIKSAGLFDGWISYVAKVLYCRLAKRKIIDSRIFIRKLKNLFCFWFWKHGFEEPCLVPSFLLFCQIPYVSRQMAREEMSRRKIINSSIALELLLHLLLQLIIIIWENLSQRRNFSFILKIFENSQPPPHHHLHHCTPSKTCCLFWNGQN